MLHSRYFAALALLSAVPLAHAAVPLPAARVNSFVTTKIINEVVDSLPPPVLDYTKTRATSDEHFSPDVGATVTALSDLTTTGVDFRGQGSSASARVQAQATADFGRLRLSSTGTASTSHLSGSTGTASGYTYFDDYLSFGGLPGSTVQLRFVTELSGSVAAEGIGTVPVPPFGARGTYASIALNSGVGDATTGQVLFNPGARSFSTATDGNTGGALFTDSGVLTVPADHVIRFNVQLSFAGSVNSGADRLKSDSGSYSADAAHTGRLFIDVLTPGATYQTASGVQYLTTAAVPEPAAPLMLLSGLAALCWRRRSICRRPRLPWWAEGPPGWRGRSSSGAARRPGP